MIYSNKRIELKKEELFFGAKVENLGIKNNLISNNYKHIMKCERIIKKLSKMNEKGINNNLNSFQKSFNKDNIKDFSETKRNENIKILINKIKNIYKK